MLDGTQSILCSASQYLVTVYDDIAILKQVAIALLFITAMVLRVFTSANEIDDLESGEVLFVSRLLESDYEEQT